MDALEEVVIVGGAGSGLFVRVMLEDLLAVGALDLIFSRFVAVLGETEDGVMVLTLKRFVVSAT